MRPCSWGKESLNFGPQADMPDMGGILPSLNAGHQGGIMEQGKCLYQSPSRNRESRRPAKVLRRFCSVVFPRVERGTGERGG